MTGLTGSYAAVYYSALRDPRDAARCLGDLVAVASPVTGGQADVLVVRLLDDAAPRYRRHVVVSLATILDIRHPDAELDPWPYGMGCVRLCRDEDCPACGWPETYAEVDVTSSTPNVRAIGCRKCGWRTEEKESP